MPYLFRVSNLFLFLWWRYRYQSCTARKQNPLLSSSLHCFCIDPISKWLIRAFHPLLILWSAFIPCPGHLCPQHQKWRTWGGNRVSQRGPWGWGTSTTNTIITAPYWTQLCCFYKSAHLFFNFFTFLFFPQYCFPYKVGWQGTSLTKDSRLKYCCWYMSLAFYKSTTISVKPHQEKTDKASENVQQQTRKKCALFNSHYDREPWKGRL